HPERQANGYGSIDRISASFEDVEACLGRQRLACGDNSTLAPSSSRLEREVKSHAAENQQHDIPGRPRADAHQFHRRPAYTFAAPCPTTESAQPGLQTRPQRTSACRCAFRLLALEQRLVLCQWKKTLPAALHRCSISP